MAVPEPEPGGVGPPRPYANGEVVGEHLTLASLAALVVVVTHADVRRPSRKASTGGGPGRGDAGAHRDPPPAP